jgi:hypothetical protein
MLYPRCRKSWRVVAGDTLIWGHRQVSGRDDIQAIAGII